MNHSVALQIQLPADLALTPEQLKKVTGKSFQHDQMAWLQDHGWVYELRGDGKLLVGTLYANLRLAGLHPAATEAPNDSAFDLSQVR
jgi:hypothetical protein